MGSSRPAAESIAAAPKQNALDIRRSQMEMEDDLRRRRGFLASQNTGAPQPNALG